MTEAEMLLRDILDRGDITGRDASRMATGVA
jgi:hypothetical protein